MFEVVQSESEVAPVDGPMKFTDAQLQGASASVSLRASKKITIYAKNIKDVT